MHTCEQCGRVDPRHYTTKHYGRCSIQLPFCDPGCERAYYLNQLNKEHHHALLRRDDGHLAGYAVAPGARPIHADPAR